MKPKQAGYYKHYYIAQDCAYQQGKSGIGPDWLKTIAHFNPMYYTVDASRVLAGGTIANMSVLEAFLVMIPLTAIVLRWATRV